MCFYCVKSNFASVRTRSGAPGKSDPFIFKLQLSFQILEDCLQRENPCQLLLNLTVTTLVLFKPLTVLKAPRPSSSPPQLGLIWRPLLVLEEEY